MRRNQSFIAVIVCLLACSNVRAQLGIWTSQTRQLSTGTVSVPTTYGQQIGVSTQLGPLTQTAAATDFGTFNAGTSRVPFYGPNLHRSYFTPDSFVLEYGEAIAHTGSGMSTTFGDQDATHIQATFHLD